jgi:hypothetical protein
MQKLEAEAREKIAQHLQSAQLDRVSRVCISTIQRLYSMLRSFVFWDRNTDAARRDQREETVGALRAIEKNRGTRSLAHLLENACDPTPR